MPDNKKKKKVDRRFIALNCPSERAYMKRIARNQLELLQKQKGREVWGIENMNVKTSRERCSKAQLVRVCKGLIKCLKRIK